MIAEAIMCLALNIYHESRSQSVKGMKAVAAVTMKRANHSPDNVCKEVFKKKQFSWANPLTLVDAKTRAKRAPKFVPTDGKSWEIAKKIATSAVYGKLKTPAPNAEYFYNPKLATPKWRNEMVLVAKIDDHIFMRKPF